MLLSSFSFACIFRTQQIVGEEIIKVVRIVTALALLGTGLRFKPTALQDAVLKIIKEKPKLNNSKFAAKAYAKGVTSAIFTICCHARTLPSRLEKIKEQVETAKEKKALQKMSEMVLEKMKLKPKEKPAKKSLQRNATDESESSTKRKLTLKRNPTDESQEPAKKKKKPEKKPMKAMKVKKDEGSDEETQYYHKHRSDIILKSLYINKHKVCLDCDGKPYAVLSDDENDSSFDPEESILLLL